MEERTAEKDVPEIEVEMVTHWGVQLLTRDGRVYTTRWDPGYGTGVNVPYTEAEARADASRDDRDWPASRKRLVTRTETTTVETTPWTRVIPPGTGHTNEGGK